MFLEGNRNSLTNHKNIHRFQNHLTHTQTDTHHIHSVLTLNVIILLISRNAYSYLTYNDKLTIEHYALRK